MSNQNTSEEERMTEPELGQVANPYGIEMDDMEPDTDDDEQDAPSGGTDGYGSGDAPQGTKDKAAGIAKKFKHRILFIIFAWVLVWVTSMSLTKDLVKALVLKNKDLEATLATSWKDVFKLGSNEAATYTSCVSKQGAYCAAGLAENLYLGQQNSNTANHTNKKKLVEVTQEQSICAKEFFSWVSFLLDWQDLVRNEFFNENDQGAMVKPVIQYKTSCTAEEISTLKDSFVKSSDNDQAFLLVNEFTDDEDKRDQNTQSQLNDRVDYDKSYVNNMTGGAGTAFVDAITGINIPTPDLTVTLGNITGEIDKLGACMEWGPDNPCGVYDQYQDLTNQFDGTKDSLNSTLQGAYDSFKEYEATSKQQMAEMAAYIEEMNRIRNLMVNSQTVLDAINIDAGGIPEPPSFCADPNCLGTLDGFTVSTPDILGGINVPNVSGIKVDTSFLDPAKNAVGGVANEVEKEAEQTRQAINNTNFDWDPAPGYNPPAVDVSFRESTEERQNERKTFTEQMGVVLDTFDRTLPDLNSGNGSRNLDDVFSAASGDLSVEFSSITIPSYEGYDSRVPNIDWLMAIFNNIGSIFIYSDIVYRIVSCIWIALKYWNMTAVGLPTIDVRAFKSKKKSGNSTMILKFMATPIVMVILALFMVGTIAALAGTLYEQMVQDYRAGCIAPDGRERNGTIITSNLRSIVYNFARFEGDTLQATLLEDYEKNRTNYCAALGQATLEAYNKNKKELTAIKNLYTRTSSRLTLIEKCIDSEATFTKPAEEMLQRFYSASNQTTEDKALTWFQVVRPNEPLPIWPYTFATSAIQQASMGHCLEGGLSPQEMVDQRFNCSILPPCTQFKNCDGKPDYLSLDVGTWLTGCRTESYGHLQLFTTVMTGIVWSCLNLTRALILGAVARFGWRNLTNEAGFTYKGNVLITGDKKSNGDGEYFDMKRLDELKDLREEGTKVIDKFSFRAWYYILISLLINMIWIVMITSISHDLEFTKTG